MALLAALETPGRPHRAHRAPAPGLGPRDPERGDRGEGRRGDGRRGRAAGAGVLRGRADARGDRPDPEAAGPRRAIAAAPARRERVAISAAKRTQAQAIASYSRGTGAERLLRPCARLALKLDRRYQLHRPDPCSCADERTTRCASSISPWRSSFGGLVASRSAARRPGRRSGARHLDVQAIDLTPAIERYRSDGDVIQISTAPGRDGIVRRIAVQGARSRHAARLDRLRAHQRHRRADRPPARRAAFPAGRLRRDLARPRRARASPPSRRARASGPSARTAPTPTSS